MIVDEFDIAACADEAIRTPGSIQPHGVLLVVSEGDFTITQASDNCAQLFGRTYLDLLGRSLDEILPSVTMDELRSAAAASLVATNPIRAFVLNGMVETRCDLLASRAGEDLILEFEPYASMDAAKTTFAQLGLSTGRLGGAENLQDYCQIVAEEVRNITDFDRVMVYQFDREWAGDVVAEAKGDNLEPFLGQRFPPSDIPEQARALYTENWLRIIGDVDYQPVAVWAEPDTPKLDMSSSVLRSVSPVHLIYLRNMGVTASMSVSLIDRGKLWGLIACHHYSGPHLLSYKVRAATELLGQTASLLLVNKERSEHLEDSLAVKVAQMNIVNSLGNRQDVGEVLTSSTPNVADLLNANGVAVSIDSKVSTVGEVPDQRWLNAIASELESSHPGATYATDSLGKINNSFLPIAVTASGVMTVYIGGRANSWIMWFRPEVVRTVKWAGDPTQKTVQHLPDGTAVIGPRRSFAVWKERVTNQSLPWTNHEVETAREFGRSITEALGRST